MKICKECGQELPESEFYPCRRDGKEYTRGKCKKCMYQYYKNLPSYKKSQKKYIKSEKRIQYMKDYRASHR